MPKFRGGTSTDSKKYLKITAGPHRGRRVNILIAEAMLGRKLKPDEEVDHRDGNRLNCEHTNLQVLSGPDHTRLENRRRWVMRHIEEKERKRWQEWIDTGGDRPGEITDSVTDADSTTDSPNEVAVADRDDLDISFNPEEF